MVAKGRGTEGGGAKWRVEHDTHPPTRRASSWHREVHPARDRGEETEQEPEGVEEVGGGDGETPRAPLVEVTCVGRDATPPEENEDLLGFTPEHAHLVLQGIYGNFPHHNNGFHLDRGIADDAAWQRCWLRIAAQSESWYATPYGAMGRCFTAILEAEWRGVI